MVVFGLVLDRVIEFTLVREFDFYLQTLAKTLAAAAVVGAIYKDRAFCRGFCPVGLLLGT